MAKIKAYKGFNKDMTCRGFQFEEWKEYTLPDGEEAKLCESGFHACETPVDCLRYYEPGSSIYREVELDATEEKRDDDTKRVGKSIRIGAEIDIACMVKAHFEYRKAHCTNEQNAEPGKPASAGYRGAASAGSYGAACSRGSVSVGKNGVACVRGNDVKARGGLGAVLLIAEENVNDYDLAAWKAAVVDGETIKADTWYELKDGKFVEVEDQHNENHQA